MGARGGGWGLGEGEGGGNAARTGRAQRSLQPAHVGGGGDGEVRVRARGRCQRDLSFSVPRARLAVARLGRTTARFSKTLQGLEVLNAFFNR